MRLEDIAPAHLLDVALVILRLVLDLLDRLLGAGALVQVDRTHFYPMTEGKSRVR